MFHEWYETPKHIWVITELANGGTLADILEEDGCIPFSQVVDFVRDITSGLSYCNLTRCSPVALLLRLHTAFIVLQVMNVACE